jgi:Plasmid pRiA4b ORF-3-like protein
MSEILVFHVRLELEGVSPAVWRRLELRAAGTFWHLHCAIQDAMPWEDRHLHEFRFPQGDAVTSIGMPDLDCYEQETVLAGWDTRLVDWFVAPPAACSYVYDFGDDWVHTVTLEARRPAERGGRYPRCTAGERRCPPEDVGGPGGYSDFLEAMADRRHPEHKTFRRWIGVAWDAGDFRPEAVRFSRPSARLRYAGLG